MGTGKVDATGGFRRQRLQGAVTGSRSGEVVKTLPSGLTHGRRFLVRPASSRHDDRCRHLVAPGKDQPGPPRRHRAKRHFVLQPCFNLNAYMHSCVPKGPPVYIHQLLLLDTPPPPHHPFQGIYSSSIAKVVNVRKGV